MTTAETKASEKNGGGGVPRRARRHTRRRNSSERPSSVFPARAPLAADVDFKFLARQFNVTGGDIRNVALDAAFLAAEDGRAVTMRHLVRATARQMLKQGKVPSPADFKQYHSLIARESSEGVGT